MEKEQKQIQLNVDPNAYFISMVNMRFDEEGFHFLFASGNQGRQFVASPKHAKRMHLLLKQQIENYEKQFGEIKTQLPDRLPASQQSGQNTQEDNKVGF